MKIPNSLPSETPFPPPLRSFWSQSCHPCRPPESSPSPAPSLGGAKVGRTRPSAGGQRAARITRDQWREEGLTSAVVRARPAVEARGKFFAVSFRRRAAAGAGIARRVSPSHRPAAVWVGGARRTLPRLASNPPPAGPASTGRLGGVPAGGTCCGAGRVHGDSDGAAAQQRRLPRRGRPSRLGCRDAGAGPHPPHPGPLCRPKHAGSRRGSVWSARAIRVTPARRCCGGGALRGVRVHSEQTGERASLVNRSWQSNRGAPRASGTAGIEPTPSE